MSLTVVVQETALRALGRIRAEDKEAFASIRRALAALSLPPRLQGAFLCLGAPHLACPAAVPGQPGAAGCRVAARWRAGFRRCHYRRGMRVGPGAGGAPSGQGEGAGRGCGGKPGETPGFGGGYPGVPRDACRLPCPAGTARYAPANSTSAAAARMGVCRAQRGSPSVLSSVMGYGRYRGPPRCHGHGWGGVCRCLWGMGSGGITWNPAVIFRGRGG
jgi:hypothetical protein